MNTIQRIKTTKHSGAIGDLICSLPYLLSTGDRYRILISRNFEVGGEKRHTKYVERKIFPFLERLLLAQPMIAAVILDDKRHIDLVLDDFRQINNYRLTSLHKMYFLRFGGYFPLARQWLFNINPMLIKDRDIIVSRTFRQNNHLFPHKQIVEQYGRRMLFIGLFEEYQTYQEQFDPQNQVKFYAIKDLYEGAQLIAGAKLCITNATVFLHIAQGLNKKRVFEASIKDQGVWISGYLEGDLFVSEIEAQNPDYVLGLIQDQLPKTKDAMSIPGRSIPDPLPVHFFTIVQNGEPFIRYHIEIFKQLPFKWHWHIIEGIADLKHDSAWVLRFGGRIDDRLHHKGLSNDGTSQYLDEICEHYPDQVTVYRKPEGQFWDGKREMVNAPLININEECLLWQVDVDEFWTKDQIIIARNMFLDHPEKTAALYWCHFFVGEDLLVQNRGYYGNHQNEWRRTWRYRPGAKWAAHEPPVLVETDEKQQLVSVADKNPFLQSETEKQGLVFQHFAYITPAQLTFKEIYYGYSSALVQWYTLQQQNNFPQKLAHFFAWVDDDALVNKAENLGITPIINTNGKTWCFEISKDKKTTTSYEQPCRSDLVKAFDAYHQGVACHKSREIEKAIEFYETALNLHPSFILAWNDMGLAFHEKGFMNKAIGCYDKALSIKPDFAESMHNMGYVNERTGNIDAAIKWYEKAVNVQPDFVNAHIRLGFCLLLKGNYSRGLKEYEYSIQIEAISQHRFSLPKWDGAPYHEKTLLLWFGQSFEEAIQLIRYAPLVKQNMGRLIVACRPELIRLFKTCDGPDQVVSLDDAIPEADFQLPAACLPGIFKKDLHTVPFPKSFLPEIYKKGIFAIPGNIPYLYPPQKIIPSITNRIEKTGHLFKIGIALTSDSDLPGELDRSYAISRFEPLFDYADIAVFNLQKSEGGDTPRSWIDLETLSDDLAYTASAIMAMDLIITVDNTIAHLTGALGKTAWLMLPYVPSWQWMLSRDDSPWYPTIQLFRQEKIGDWESVMIGIENNLKQLIKREPDYKKSGKQALIHAIGNTSIDGVTGYGIHAKYFFRHLNALYPITRSELINPQQFDYNIKTMHLEYASAPKIHIAIAYGNVMKIIFNKCKGQKIGFTVWESTRIPDDWLDPMKELDQIWVPTHWGKDVLAQNGLNEARIRVVPEGVDTDIFHLENEKAQEIASLPGYKFLHIGKFEERKFTKHMITAFDKAFAHTKDAALILSCHNPFIKDFDINKELEKMPLKHRDKIYTVDRVISHQDFATLYAACDAFLYPTRAEGWGLPLIEAMASGLPAIVTNYSGLTEFANTENAYMINYEMEDIQQSYFLSRSNNYGQWAGPDTDHLIYLMRYVFEHREEAYAKGKKAANDIANNWTWNNAAQKALEILNLA